MGLLILVAIISIAATATVQLGAVTQRRSAEEELLHVGRQFRAALFSYQNSSPAGMPRLPKELSDLVKDPRQPALRRHLRRIPVDPITGKAEWGGGQDAGRVHPGGAQLVVGAADQGGEFRGGLGGVRGG